MTESVSHPLNGAPPFSFVSLRFGANDTGIIWRVIFPVSVWLGDVSDNSQN